MTLPDPYMGVVLASAEEIPELPDARIVLIDEGGFKPDGYWRVAYRVHHQMECNGNSVCWCQSVAPKLTRSRKVFQELLVCTPTDG